MRSRLVIFGVTVALLGITVRAYQFVLEWRFLARNANFPILASSSFALLQIAFILCFVVCATGLLIRNRGGLILSTFGLLGLFVCHIAWHAYTNRSLRVFENEPFYALHPEYIPPHLFGLVGAKWWDIVILFCSVILFIWELKALTVAPSAKSR